MDPAHHHTPATATTGHHATTGHATAGHAPRHVIATPIWVLVLRIIALLNAIVIMGYAGHGLALYNGNYYGYYYYSTTELAAPILASVFTLIALLYIILTEKIAGASAAYNIYAVLALDALLIALWFASTIVCICFGWVIPAALGTLELILLPICFTYVLVSFLGTRRGAPGTAATEFKPQPYAAPTHQANPAHHHTAAPHAGGPHILPQHEHQHQHQQPQQQYAPAQQPYPQTTTPAPAYHQPTQ